jgi:pancreatic triacylglycerol lipase
VIHTEAGTLGADVSTGTVDFWPNGGRTQPGCSFTDGGSCSHARSIEFFAESVSATEPKFYAIKCLNLASFRNETCKEKFPLANMGIDANPRSVGNFFLQTNPKSPFSRGIFGTQFIPNTDDRESLN